MFRSAKSKFDLGELTRKLKRTVDGSISYRKLFILLLCLAVFFYIIPPVFRYLFSSKTQTKDPLVRCMDDRLTPFFIQSLEYNANIRHVPFLPEENNFIPYIGNGFFGVEVSNDSPMRIKSGRSMQLPVPFYPIISLSPTNGIFREATVVEYQSGIVHRFQCFQDYFGSYKYYAHRTLPEILVQEIQITNTRNQIFDVELVLPRSSLQSPVSRVVSIKSARDSAPTDYDVVSAAINLKDKNNNIIVVSIVHKKISQKLTLKKRGITKLDLLMAIHYTKPIPSTKFSEVVEENEKLAIASITMAAQKVESGQDSLVAYNEFRKQHIRVWNDLWATGFSISTSKAENSINGDRINATIYAVLSQVRSYELEEVVSLQKKQDIAKALSYAEGCYDSYHTLQADNLWLGMDSIDNLNSLVSSWMLTLEKQGCHNLIRAGASGVIQAMVLSFGSLRFSNQHLEFNIHPKFLHRDFNFRRLNYGNRTHVNVTVTVTEDNKAVINVALDRSDRSYYACDAGCLDEPVLLGQGRKQFPVKLTEPITAILYITADKQHMEELHKAIHVKEVAEAPAHEHHVIALHKHGHHLGGLPTLFWVSICAIIVVFHIFLCKLIIKEYCEPSDKLRYRYNKP